MRAIQFRRGKSSTLYLAALLGVTEGLVLPSLLVFAQKPRQSGILRNKMAPALVLSCRLWINKKVFRMTEVPRIHLFIKNERDVPIYFVRGLEGSDWGMRYPHYLLSIRDSSGKAVKPRSSHCGNTQPLQAQNFLRLAPKRGFNTPLYAGANDYRDQRVTPNALFLKPGKYRLQFHLSTRSPKIEDWLGDGIWGWRSKHDPKLVSLFKKVPKLEIDSNPIDIEFVR